MIYSLPPFGQKRIHVINWYGLWTLYCKEVRRFMKVQMQTLAAPAVTALLYMAIFVVAMGRTNTVALGVPYPDFIAPGLIAMAMVQNAFANSSSSIIIGKMQGTLVDVLMPPLSSGELLVAYVGGAVTRGLMVGLAVWLAVLLLPGVDVPIRHLWAVLYFGIMGTAMLALVGVITGQWAEKFDHTSAITNFIIQPLTFLSGTFYTLDRLPHPWRDVSLVNPFFHIIDGFRYGFINAGDAPIWWGVVVLAIVNSSLWILCSLTLKRGWKLRA
jgi:ABC-2 type transport system permease protein